MLGKNTLGVMHWVTFMGRRGAEWRIVAVGSGSRGYCTVGYEGSRTEVLVAVRALCCFPPLQRSGSAFTIARTYS